MLPLGFPFSFVLVISRRIKTSTLINFFSEFRLNWSHTNGKKNINDFQRVFIRRLCGMCYFFVCTKFGLLLVSNDRLWRNLRMHKLIVEYQFWILFVVSQLLFVISTVKIDDDTIKYHIYQWFYSIFSFIKFDDNICISKLQFIENCYDKHGTSKILTLR